MTYKLGDILFHSNSYSAYYKVYEILPYGIHMLTPQKELLKFNFYFVNIQMYHSLLLEEVITDEV